MNRVLAILTLLFLVSSNVCAQKLDWIIKAGVNMSSITGGDVFGTTKYKPDLVVGMAAEYQISHKFGIGAEVLYSGQGYTLETANTQLRYDYCFINVPFLACWYITDNLRFKTGIQFGAPFSASVDQKIDGAEGDSVSVRTPKFDFSIPISLSYSLDCGLIFDLRYNMGISNIHLQTKQYSPFVKVNNYNRNSVFAFTVGWRI